MIAATGQTRFGAPHNKGVMREEGGGKVAWVNPVICKLPDRKFTFTLFQFQRWGEGGSVGRAM